MSVAGWAFRFFAGFVQLAIAVDVLGTLPIYLSMVESVEPAQRGRLLRGSLVTALLVGLLFLLLGKAVFEALAISLGDFEMAGGLILILIGAVDLLGEEKQTRRPMEAFGSVPLGVPLIVGPAVISMLLLLVDHLGLGITLAAFVVNIAVAGLVFRYATVLTRVIGKNGVKAASKIAMLLLIAFGAKMLRQGIVSSFGLS